MKASRAAALLCVAALAVSGAVPGSGALPADRAERRASTLSVWHDGAWREFWRSDRAPTSWIAPDAQLRDALQWRRLANGLEWATLRLSCGGPTCRARFVVARLDPTVMKLSLRMDLTRDEMRPAWSIDRAPAEALLAVNAGQFGNTMPWGWVALDGRQVLRPGYGPLSSAVAFDAAGSVRWFHGDSLLEASGVTAGFQSYPTLLAGDGLVPPALRSGEGVNLTHRDTRLAIGETRDGRILIAMTRFDAVGELSQGFPLGPTTPEMAALMGALGASDAVMLDGGISAQLLLRDRSRGKTMRWPGLRKVPLALIATPRPVGATTSKR
jgi:hypothetical protein